MAFGSTSKQPDSVQVPTGACEKVTSDLGFGGGFLLVLRSPPPLTNGYSRLGENKRDSKLLHPTSSHLYNSPTKSHSHGKEQGTYFTHILRIS